MLELIGDSHWGTMLQTLTICWTDGDSHWIVIGTMLQTPLNKNAWTDWGSHWGTMLQTLTICWTDGDSHWIVIGTMLQTPLNKNAWTDWGKSLGNNASSPPISAHFCATAKTQLQAHSLMSNACGLNKSCHTPAPVVRHTRTHTHTIHNPIRRYMFIVNRPHPLSTRERPCLWTFSH